jgi:predicted aspartyl protease
MAEETGLLDTGATESFIDHKTVVRLCLGTQKLMVPRPVYNVDGSAN